MQLLLHPVKDEVPLSHYYKRAFSNATHLFVVSAYLTEWDSALRLNRNCEKLRIITGKDFGITRKAACEAVMKWLPAKRKANFLVANRIDGFHPKAVFWKEANGKAFALVGSSNLTKAAFETNYEANVYLEISPRAFESVDVWIADIESECVPMSKDWLDHYNEAPRVPGKRGGAGTISASVVGFPLPRPHGIATLIKRRRDKLSKYAKNRRGLMNLFRRCAARKIDNKTFYKELPDYWSDDVGDRLQGAGWERKGSSSNFRALSESFLRVVDASATTRDDIVIQEFDRLARLHIAARKAFLSEMLCLRFPNAYPVLNLPVLNFLRAVKFRPPRGATEGARYIDLARKLRFSLIENPDHPAKNLAEIDTLIWKKYGKKRGVAKKAA